MLTSSAKAKGRRLQQKVASLILATFKHLTERDVQSTSMGANGVDVKLSELAHKAVPFAIETKNKEANRSLILAWEQTKSNCQEGEEGLLILSANKSKILAILEFEVLLKILKENHEYIKS